MVNEDPNDWPPSKDRLCIDDYKYFAFRCSKCKADFVSDGFIAGLPKEMVLKLRDIFIEDTSKKCDHIKTRGFLKDL